MPNDAKSVKCALDQLTLSLPDLMGTNSTQTQFMEVFVINA